MDYEQMFLLDMRDDETPLQYHRRLLEAKLIDKTLDLDYSDLAKYLYGKEYSSDVARRMAYGSMKTLELLSDECVDSIEDRDILAEIEKKRTELHKERQRFYDQRREYNKLVNADGRLEHLEERLLEAALALNESVSLRWDEHTPVVDTYDPGREAVLVFCDWHYGMTTHNIWNDYDTSVCQERVRKVVDEAIDRLRLYHPRRLHVFVLGDMIHGACHVSARVASEELVCDQLMQVSEILARAISELSQFVEEVDVYSTYGNHARTVQNKADSIHRDNLERIIPWWLTQRLQAIENVVVKEPSDTEFIYTDVCGYGFCASHGDLDSVKRAPKTLSVLFQKKLGKDVDYVILADKHHREMFEEFGVTAEICGALCGAEDFANDHRLYSTPSQLMLIVDRDEGVYSESRLTV